VARVLIVGCGCRGRSLAGALAAAGHTVRGTTRDPARAAPIEAAGAEPVVADPDRLGTLMGALAGVSVVCWLLGSADGSGALHGERLSALTERLVDTPVRGLVYEAAGTVDRELLAGGAAIVRQASQRWHIPVEVVSEDPANPGRWTGAMAAAVGRLLGC